MCLLLDWMCSVGLYVSTVGLMSLLDVSIVGLDVFCRTVRVYWMCLLLDWMCSVGLYVSTVGLYVSTVGLYVSTVGLYMSTVGPNVSLRLSAHNNKACFDTF